MNEEELLNENNSIWKVENLLEKKYDEDGETLFKVKWKESDEITWEPKKNLDNCKELLKNFAKKFKKLVIVKDMQKVKYFLFF
jgi:hypothetical protein